MTLASAPSNDSHAGAADVTGAPRNRLVLRTVFDAASVDGIAEVWRALTVNRSQWWPGLMFEATPGGVVHEDWEDDGQRGTASGVVREVSVGELISFAWKDDHHDESLPLIEVTWTLSENSTGVELELTESGFASYPDSAALFNEHIEGWAFHLSNLRSFLVPQIPATSQSGDSTERISLVESEVVGFLTQRVLHCLSGTREPQALDFSAVISSLGSDSNKASDSQIPSVRTPGSGGEQRLVFAIAGKPGSGKSTLVEALRDTLEEQGISVAVLPMDGFHLSNSQLERLGIANVKGAPTTFDAHGYVSALRRVVRGDNDVFVPVFHREIEESYAADGCVPAAAQVVLTEGNYLLLPDAPWADVRGLITQSWYVEPDDQVRIDRLVARHVVHGKTPSQAIDWALGTDEANARVIERSAHRADLVISVVSQGRIKRSFTRHSQSLK